jgi:hypothetical protein
MIRSQTHIQSQSIVRGVLLLYIELLADLLLLATTERDIRLQLVKEEEAEASRGILPPHDVSPSSFLHAGLELEDQQ